MLMPRVIPVLLFRKGGLYKTTRFKNPVYVGDPINAVRIFNEKEVDELVFVDITATPERRGPNFDYIREVASECFMPLCYGGGVRSLEDVKAVISCGVEKVAINSLAVENPDFIREAASEFASSTIVVSVDVKRDFFGRYHVYSHGGTRKAAWHPVEFVMLMEKMGAGEILLTSVDRDGTKAGYDIELIRSVSEAVGIPVIACGGAGCVADFSQALEARASAVAAGSMFVFHGRHRAVLINFPSQEELKGAFFNRA
ncbi:MAG TPA: AglZ/HisF2 family acetamidino modification protein [Blastocatellia bacterium]|nr:AglZ/HisF2 family acetamidino modification protein [Blastocatellia bacterium]